MDLVQRKSNFELMRIFAIFLIVIFHASMDLNQSMNFQHVFTPNMIPIFLLGGWGRLGVGLFVIVSSWYLQEKEFDPKRGKKFIYICYITVYYAFLVPFIMKLTHLREVSISDFLKALLSPFINSYWYVSSYLMLLVFYPIINKCIKALSYQELKYTTVAMLIISDIWSILALSRVAQVTGEFMTFLTLYFLVACMKRKPDNWFMKKSGMKAVLMYFLIIGICVFTEILGTYFNIHFLISIAVRILNNNSIFIDFFAILIFCVFFKMNIKYNVVLNTIAKTTLGVYVLHTTSAFSCDGWDRFFFLGRSFLEDSVMIFTLRLVASAGLVFVIGVVLDLIRIYAIDSWLFSIKPISLLIEKWNSILNYNLSDKKKEKL